MRILSFTAENYKRIRIVEIRPQSALIDVAGPNESGKQQPVTEPVLTPDGWRPIGTIRVGNYVIGSNGKPTRVVGVFPQSERRTFSVKMVDGGSTRCGPDHLWTVSSWNKSRPNARKAETLSTATLIERGLRMNKGASRKWSIQSVASVQFADSGQNLPIDPYILGVILGDGHVESSGYVTITSWDEEILSEVVEKISGGHWRGEHEVATGSWSRPLRHLGLGGVLSFNKFVPDIYLMASATERRELLAGLLDSDGTATDSWAEFCSTSERLADAVVTLGLSLGYVCKKGRGLTKKYRHNGELKTGRIAWLVNVKSPESPFRLMRKTKAWSPSIQKSGAIRLIDSITPVDDEDSVCIKVAAKDGLYVTKDFILTHNTSVGDAIWAALEYAKHVQKTPIRKGQKKARIEITLGTGEKVDYVVRRTFNAQEAGGFTTAVVVEKIIEDGVKARLEEPQKILNNFIGALAFDPIAFMNMKPREQFDAMAGFVPDINFDALAKADDADREARLLAGREAAALNARAAAIIVPADAPLVRIDKQALLDELRIAGETNVAYEKQLADRNDRSAAIARRADVIGRLKLRHRDLLLEAAKVATDISTLEAQEAIQQSSLNALQALAAPVDVGPIIARITEADAENARVDLAARLRADSMRLGTEADVATAKVAGLTRQIAAREAARRAAIAKAKMPVEGISFGDGVVLYHELPLDQASGAQQVLLCTAIAAAMNPRLPVIWVKNGNDLDAERMEILRKFAEEKQLQVWIEKVGDTSRAGVIMEDGHLKGIAVPKEFNE